MALFQHNETNIFTGLEKQVECDR